MAAFRRRQLVRDYNPVTDRPEKFDLPVDPISAIIIGLRWTSPDPALRDFNPWNQALSLITQVRLHRRGVDILRAPLTDLAVLNAIAAHCPPHLGARARALGGANFAHVYLCFGRRYCDPAQCLPAQPRGDLILELQASETDAGAGSLRLDIDTLELPGAQPSSHLRMRQIERVLPNNDPITWPLPTRTQLLGVLLRDPFPPDTANSASDYGQMSVAGDNVEIYYPSINWDAARGDLARALGDRYALDEHIHAALSEHQSSAVVTAEFLREYGWLDFDPLRDRSTLLDTGQYDQVELRTTPTAGTAIPIRIVTLEHIPLTGGA